MISKQNHSSQSVYTVDDSWSQSAHSPSRKPKGIGSSILSTCRPFHVAITTRLMVSSGLSNTAMPGNTAICPLGACSGRRNIKSADHHHQTFTRNRNFPTIYRYDQTVFQLIPPSRFSDVPDRRICPAIRTAQQIPSAEGREQDTTP